MMPKQQKALDKIKQFYVKNKRMPVLQERIYNNLLDRR